MQSAAGTSAPGATKSDEAVGRNFGYHELLGITEDFSEKIGEGGYADVYKGKLSKEEEVSKEEEIAVKMLKANNCKQIDGEQFKKELQTINKKSVQHDNIVRFVGYCDETTPECHEGQDAKRIRRALCFEYMPNGSLKDHFEDESLDWRSRYEIIKGICVGLNHLHSKNIVHRDLKLENILLDGAMKPKLADFGLSRSLNAQETSQITGEPAGTLGYMPPEFLRDGRYSKESDIYSLGTVIEKILTGPAKGNDDDPSLSLSLEKAIEYWKQRLEPAYVQKVKELCDDDLSFCVCVFKTIEYWEQRPEIKVADVERVKACMALVRKCCQHDRNKRPTIQRVIDTLNYTDISLGGPQHYSHSGGAKKGETMEGGEGGDFFDINTDVAPPHRLMAVWLKHGYIIDSLKFSYTDCNGVEHSKVQWGPPEAYDKIFRLEPYEYLVEVSGTMGEYAKLPTNIIKSLTFVTNVNSYRTRGTPEGKPFKLEAPSGSCIVGFYARAGSFLDAIESSGNMTYLLHC